MRKLIALIFLAPLLALSDEPSPIVSWGQVHAPAAAAQATTSKAAAVGVRHVATSVTVCAIGVAAQGPITFNLRNGATGAGTIIWTVTLSAAAGASQCVTANLHLPGSTNTAMTLESAAAPAATNFATVSLAGYEFQL